ncbi:hypothetical protein GCM10020000_84910 [Streptomyces olivoverticillatus]
MNPQCLSIQNNGETKDGAGINMRNCGPGNAWQAWRITPGLTEHNAPGPTGPRHRGGVPGPGQGPRLPGCCLLHNQAACRT